MTEYLRWGDDMAGSLCKWLAGCAFLGACLGVSPVHAATGRIAFSGAVVESTCTTEAAPVVAAANAAERHSCRHAASDPGPSYSRVISKLGTAGLARDPLLAYFASYAVPAAVGTVIVRTYD